MSTSVTTTMAINVAALVFVGARAQLARRALKQSVERQKQEWLRLRRQATIEISESTQQYREELKARLPWNDRDPRKVAAFFEERKDSYAELAPVRAHLNHLEDLAVGVKAGVFDLETVEMLSGSRIIATAENYAGYVSHIRSELNNPGVYENLYELLGKLKAIEAAKVH